MYNAPGSRAGPQHLVTHGTCNSLWCISEAVVVFSASPFPVRAYRKLQLAMQEQDTILEDGQAGHVDGLGSGSQTAASLPVTEGEERMNACSSLVVVAQASPSPESISRGLALSETLLNSWDRHGPWIHSRYFDEARVLCQFGIASRTAEHHQRRVWHWGQGGHGRAYRPLWIMDSGDTEPQEGFRGAGRQVHTTIGGGEIGVCPLSFPYHATRPACQACPNPAAEQENGASPKGGLGRAGRVTGWLCLLGAATEPRRSDGVEWLVAQPRLTGTGLFRCASQWDQVSTHRMFPLHDPLACLAVVYLVQRSWPPPAARTLDLAPS